MFTHLNHSVLSTCNVPAVKYQECALGVPSGALVIRINQCVRDDEETMVFCSCVFHKKMRNYMNFIPTDLYKCALLIINVILL